MSTSPVLANHDSRTVSTRWWALLAVVAAMDALFIATSILHTLSERGADVGFRFNGLHVEDQFGIPSRWQSAKSGLAAASIGVVCLRSRRWNLLPWIVALGLISASLATRFQDHVGGNSTIGTVLVAVSVLGLALAGATSESKTPNARAVVAAFVAFLIVGGALDLLGDVLLETFLQPIVSIVEGGAQLLLLTLVCAAVIDFALTHGD